MKYEPAVLPDAHEIERACIVMTAATGRVWAKMSTDEAQVLRVMANAFLLYRQVGERRAVLAAVKDKLEASAKAQRQAATALTGKEVNEPLIQALYQGAATVGTVLAILDGEEDGEEF